ncbi:protein arginine N-methyltransferase 1.6, partial [Tanacetum coccineum]
KPITADIVELAKMMKEARISRVEVRMEKIEVCIRESKMSHIGHAFSALARSYPENTHVLPIEQSLSVNHLSSPRPGDGKNKEPRNFANTPATKSCQIQGVRRGVAPTFMNSADAPSRGSHGSQAQAYKFQELGATQNKSTDTANFGSNSAETEFKEQNGNTDSSNDGTTIDSNSAQNESIQTEIKLQMQSRDSTNNSESSDGNSDQSMTTQTESQEQTQSADNNNGSTSESNTTQNESAQEQTQSTELLIYRWDKQELNFRKSPFYGAQSSLNRSLSYRKSWTVVASDNGMFTSPEVAKSFDTTNEEKIYNSGPKRTRTYIPREREEAEQRLIDDYFSDDETSPKYPEENFRRSHTQLAYDTAPDAFDECLQIAERFSRQCLENFIKCIYILYVEKYPRKPTSADIEKTYALHEEKHGLSGMLGSIDCMHWEWRNCPKSLHGQFKRRDHKYPTLMLEAVADKKLWIWHAYFGVPRANNNLNALYGSPLFDDELADRAPKMSICNLDMANTVNMLDYCHEKVYSDIGVKLLNAASLLLVYGSLKDLKFTLRLPHQTKDVLFTNASALSYGAGGYGSFDTTFYNGHLAGGVPSIFKLGSGCGACF